MLVAMSVRLCDWRLILIDVLRNRRSQARSQSGVCAICCSDMLAERV